MTRIPLEVVLVSYQETVQSLEVQLTHDVQASYKGGHRIHVRRGKGGLYSCWIKNEPRVEEIVARVQELIRRRVLPWGTNKNGRRAVRDNQQGKLYEAERQLAEFDGPVMSLEECDQFISEVCETEGFSPVRVENGRVNALAFPRERRIKLPEWARTKLVCLHELAHIETPLDVASHGPEYAATYCWLAGRWMGFDIEERLRAEFVSVGVKVADVVRLG